MPREIRSRPGIIKTGGRHWTFLSSHAQVALCLARDTDMRLRDVAGHVGITERAVQKIVSDLADEGYIERKREGRRNHYVLNFEQPLRHPLGNHKTLGSLLNLLNHRDS